MLEQPEPFTTYADFEEREDFIYVNTDYSLAEPWLYRDYSTWQEDLIEDVTAKRKYPVFYGSWNPTASKRWLRGGGFAE